MYLNQHIAIKIQLYIESSNFKPMYVSMDVRFTIQ
jgi:hypothetical protein